MYILLQILLVLLKQNSICNFHNSFPPNESDASFRAGDSFSFLYISYHPAHTIPEVISMASYVSPAVRDKFETLSVELKNTILERNVQLNTIYDLIHVLEQIVAESEG